MLGTPDVTKCGDFLHNSMLVQGPRFSHSTRQECKQYVAWPFRQYNGTLSIQMTSVCLFIVLCGALLRCSAQPIEQSAFSPEKRFASFRFEAPLGNQEAAALQRTIDDVVRVAERNSAFGWVQSIPTGQSTKLVGEVRLPFERLPVVESALRQHSLRGDTDEQAHILHYNDGKIRYHFSDFRVLESGRRTCFPTAPHQCSPSDEEL